MHNVLRGPIDVIIVQVIQMQFGEKAAPSGLSDPKTEKKKKRTQTIT